MRYLAALALSQIVLFGCVHMRPHGPAHSNGLAVKVIVEDRDTHDPISGATVVVFGEDGGIILETRTDDMGMAMLPVRSVLGRPKYLVVAADHYFLSGLPWRENSREYWVLMSILLVR